MMRIIFGAVAGLCATMAMTMAMRRLYPLLPPGERYPLPPAEILASVCGSTNDRAHTSRTVLAHFLYGSLSGAIYPLVRNKLGGAGYGFAIWAASYLGWIPAAGILTPATKHRVPRNLLMLAAHVVWGTALAAGFRELEFSRNDIFTRGPARDVLARQSPDREMGIRRG